MDLRPPLLLINLKAYPNATGQAALALGKRIQEAVAGHEAHVALCVTAPDVRELAAQLDLPVLAQHIDAGIGAFTGSVPVPAVRAWGGAGSLLNHAERQLTTAQVARGVAALREHGLLSVVCSTDEVTTAALAPLRPDYLAVEPPELIGGDISVTTADPEVVRRSVGAAGAVPTLCGAGVKDRRDAAAAIGLGTRGVLVSSGVVRAKDPGGAARELLLGLLGTA